jgi:hypothetical protein
MLITAMDVPAAHEPEFNRWYDQEHLAERVSIDGFIEARRYIAHVAAPKYLCLYSTATFDVLTSDPYQRALSNQTDWSRLNISRFHNMIRILARISIGRGQGRGAALAMVRIRPEQSRREAFREKLRELLDPDVNAGIISMHLIESDPGLSRSLTEPTVQDPGAGDWFVLFDGVNVDAVTTAAGEFAMDPSVSLERVISTGTYRLLWDLGKSDLASS